MSEVFNASSPDLRTDRQLLATTPPPRGLLLRVGRARPGLGGADDPGSQWHLLPDIVVPHPPLRLRPAGKFTLTKFLPAQAGLGGGSADAAAALRLLARANGLAPDDPRLYQAARETGADVPVCLDPRSRWMRGIGEVLSAPVSLPRLPAVLVRPDVALATRDVFAALKAAPLTAKPSATLPDLPADAASLVHFIAAQSNDLERPATSIAPQVVAALSALRTQPLCLLARMSGSGSACFGLFGSPQSAADAARSLATAHPRWWVQPTTIGAVS